MCIIVDANVRDKFFGSPIDADAAPIMEWIVSSDGRFIVGGQLTRELAANEKIRRLLVVLNRTGKALVVPSRRVDQKQRELIRSKLCKSNDHHIIALASVSGARLLYSEDKQLHADFKNPELLNRPRGVIYQNASHRRLLRHCSSCGYQGSKQARRQH